MLLSFADKDISPGGANNVSAQAPLHPFPGASPQPVPSLKHLCAAQVGEPRGSVAPDGDTDP